jgi:hypothetical protein
MPLALTDPQLEAIMVASGPMTPEKRSLFLERVAARTAERRRWQWPVALLRLAAVSGRPCK